MIRCNRACPSDSRRGTRSIRRRCKHCENRVFHTKASIITNRYCIHNSEVNSLNVPASGRNMDDAIIAIQNLLRYEFNEQTLIVEALTHTSYNSSCSYERLEFIGDSALGTVISNYLYLTYKELGPGLLSLLRSVNISTERLARVAVKYDLYQYVRRISPSLDEKVREFTIAVDEENELSIYGGSNNAPKILADIVESLAAAVYVDCMFDLERLWKVFRRLLEPIVTLEDIDRYRHPVTTLFELCQKNGQKLDFAYWRNGPIEFSNVFIDGQLIASGSSNKKDFAKLGAAKEALQKLIYGPASSICIDEPTSYELFELAEAKQKLHDICMKKKWQKPCYKIEKESGPLHERTYVCSASIMIEGVMLCAKGDPKKRVLDAERSAAMSVHHRLCDDNYM